MNFYEINNKIAFNCTDCASNISSLFDNIQWFPCCNHIINVCINDCLKYMPEILSLAQRLSSLHNSYQFKHYLCLQEVERKTFPNYSPTRWYSLADIFQAAVDLKAIIISYQNIRKQNKKNCLRKGYAFLDNRDFILCSDYSEFFNQIKILMLDLEKNSEASIFWALSNIMTIYFDLTQKLISYGYIEAADSIKKGILQRFVKYKKKNFLYYLMAASYLNPFLDINAIKIPEEDLPEDFKDLDKKFIKFMKKIVPNAFSEININQTSTNFHRRGQIINAQNSNEFQILISMKRNQGTGISLWWSLHKYEMPSLYELAEKLLTLRATSCSVERVFSKGRFMIDDYSGAMTKEHMAKRVFLYCNNRKAREKINNHIKKK